MGGWQNTTLGGAGGIYDWRFTIFPPALRYGVTSDLWARRVSIRLADGYEGGRGRIWAFKTGGATGQADPKKKRERKRFCRCDPPLTGGPFPAKKFSRSPVRYQAESLISFFPVWQQSQNQQANARKQAQQPQDAAITFALGVKAQTNNQHN